MAPAFRVVAIVAAYNEADIIAQVVADLIDQGVLVYMLDDGSTDGTAAIVEPLIGRGLLRIEALRPPAAAPEPFDWERILRRKAEVAREVEADWCIHHDADEFRESPWRGVPLAEALARVDAAGFTAVDFASLDFWPTHDRFQPGDDVRAAFPFYAERAPYDRVQVRAWKRTGAAVDLASSGGHEAQFHGRSVFPLRFISRHYPIRGQAHGARKVLRERVGRFRGDERARGWHVQYDGVLDNASFIHDPATMTRYDADAVRMALSLRHRGVEALEAALDEARAIADAHQRDLEAHRAELARCGAWALSLEAALRQMAAAAAEQEAALEKLRAATAQLALGEAEAAARAQEIAAARAFIAHQAHTIAGLDDALRDRDRRLDAVHRSLSWRLTAPARALLRAFTRA
jgi:glycosyl transferase family 2